jgi:sterol desaturase/sphingolipid hydroxylase (fatty acid hydroxylase superfamily)
MSSSSFAAQTTPGGIRRAIEARKARRRLYPVSAVYSLGSLTMLGFCLASEHSARGLLCYVFGFFAWTWVEYEVHRYVLHGRFPDGPGLLRHFLHKNFDHLHWEHHARPWDGNHVNGTLKDTGLFVALLLALSLLFPSWTASMLIAGVIQAYIIEEWVHHSVHFCRFKNKYFRYIRRHHLYHHSPRGSEAGYGLTNGFWDIVYATRFSAGVRRALYGKRPARRRPDALRPAA